jgi:ribosomal protein S17
MIFKKKTWPEYFEKILSGEKTFDCRVADFDVSTGDTIIFEEYDPQTKSYTGRTLSKTISYVGKTKNWVFYDKKEVEKYGFVIMSLK